MTFQHLRAKLLVTAEISFLGDTRHDCGHNFAVQHPALSNSQLQHWWHVCFEYIQAHDKKLSILSSLPFWLGERFWGGFSTACNRLLFASTGIYRQSLCNKFLC